MSNDDRPTKEAWKYSFSLACSYRGSLEAIKLSSLQIRFCGALTNITDQSLAQPHLLRGHESAL